MNDEVADAKEIESRANYWAGRVVKNIKEREEEVSEKEALKILAILDADNDITEQMDSDDLDAFLDEFEDAIATQDKKADAIQDRIKDADTTTVTDESDSDSDKGGGDE